MILDFLVETAVIHSPWLLFAQLKLESAGAIVEAVKLSQNSSLSRICQAHRQLNFDVQVKHEGSISISGLRIMLKLTRSTLPKLQGNFDLSPKRTN